MLSLFSFAILAASNAPTTADLAGDYTPDFSQAPASSGVLQTYFQGDLYLDHRGAFFFPSTQQSGVWRIEAGELVLVYDHFFNVWYPETNEQLQRVIPKTEMEGHALEILPGGSLELRSLGAANGPVIFRRQPRRETRELVRQSQGDGGASSLAFSILWDEQPQRWREMLSMALDPKEKISDRSWAADMIDDMAGAEAGRGLVDALRHLDGAGMTAKESEGMRTRFVRSIDKFHDVTLVKSLLAEDVRKTLPISPLADAIATSKCAEGLPYLEAWARDPKPGIRAAACKAMVMLDMKAALPYVRPFASDADASTRIWANEGVLKLSEEPKERKAAMATLVEATKSHEEYTNIFAIEGLAASGSKEVVPILLSILKDDTDGFARRTAAEQLGNLGFQEAIPALRQICDDRKPFKGPTLEWLGEQAAASGKPGYDKYIAVTVLNALQKLEKSPKRDVAK